MLCVCGLCVWGLVGVVCVWGLVGVVCVWLMCVGVSWCCVGVSWCCVCVAYVWGLVGVGVCVAYLCGG